MTGAYDIESVRAEWVGRVVSASRGRYPVEHDPIRRWCHMVGDLNPLYLDPEAAASGPHGEVIAPLTLVPSFAGNGPWPKHANREGAPPGFTLGVPTPGDRGINMGVAWEYSVPVRIGDRLRAEVRIADVFVKAIRLDPEAVWIVADTEIFNQDDVKVVVMRNTVLVHRTPEQIGARQ
jgi:acyl dehydratase